MSPEVLDAIARGGSALALLEALVIYTLWREVGQLRKRIEELHEFRLAEAMKIVTVLEPVREQNEIAADTAEILAELRDGKRKRP